MDETILRFGNLVSIPGEKFEYSNLGYGILGYAVSRVSGQSYEDYLRDSVFRKLGLTHTSVGIGPAGAWLELTRSCDLSLQRISPWSSCATLVIADRRMLLTGSWQPFRPNGVLPRPRIPPLVPRPSSRPRRSLENGAERRER